MRRFLAVLAAAGLSAMVFVSDSQALEKTTVGNATTVVRTVTGTFEADLRIIAYLDDLYHNELVETDDESAIEIVFLDETKLAMGPDSSLVLDKFVYDPDPNQSAFVVTATQGVFRFVSGKLPKKSYTIRTPTATIGIRGTAFTLTVLPEQGSEGQALVKLVLESGTALVTSCANETVVVEAPTVTAITIERAGGTCLTTLATARAERPLDHLSRSF